MPGTDENGKRLKEPLSGGPATEARARPRYDRPASVAVAQSGPRTHPGCRTDARKILVCNGQTSIVLRQADLRPCHVCVGKAGRDSCEDLIARLTSRVVVLQEPPEAVLDRLRLALLAELPHRHAGLGCQLLVLRHRSLDLCFQLIQLLQYCY